MGIKVITSASLEGRSHLVQGVDNLSLNRIVEERPADSTHYMMPCVHTIRKGLPIGGTYPGPTFIYIAEGDYTVQDREKPEQPFDVKAGDFVYVENGSLLKWTTPVKGKAFGVIWSPIKYWPDDIVADVSGF